MLITVPTLQIDDPAEILRRELVLPPGQVMRLSDDQESGITEILRVMSLYLTHMRAAIDNIERERTTTVEEARVRGVRPPPEEEPSWGDQEAWAAWTTGQEGAPQVLPPRILRVVLNGSAGTGKTTILRALLRRLSWAHMPIQVLAPTGKAVARARQILRQDPTTVVLAQDSRTIHSFLYGAPVEVAECPECHAWSQDLAKLPESDPYRVCPNEACQSRIPLATEMKTKLIWTPPVKGNGLSGGICAVVDEASMVSKTVDRDLGTALLPGSVLIYVGDREQIPPIAEEEGPFNRDEKKAPTDLWGPDFEHPTVTLSKIHRQAEGNPILPYVTAIREGRLVKPPNQVMGPLPAGNQLKFHLWVELADVVTWAAEHRNAGRDCTVICYTNATRKALNRAIRYRRGVYQKAEERGVPIIEDDILICRANGILMNGETLPVTETAWEDFATYESLDYRHGILRGMKDCRVLRVTTSALAYPIYVLPRAIGETSSVFRDARRDIERTERLIYDFAEQNGQDPVDVMARNRALETRYILHVDFGEAITAHVSQGSQWKKVAVVWDSACWGMWYNDQPAAKRWLYTASTRAEETLDVFSIRKNQGAST